MSRASELCEKRKTYSFPMQVPLYKEPIHLVKAKGSWVWDDTGRQYLDAIGGIVSISVGHNHDRIQNKIKDMVENDAIQHTTYLYLSGPSSELSQKLAELAPLDNGKCYLTNSGSEANEMAVLAARTYTRRSMIVALRHGYHGGTGTPMALCGHSKWKYQGTPQSEVTHAQAPYCYRCPFGAKPDSCNLECAADVKETIETTTDGEIAGMIVEPVLGVGGFITPPVEYHKEIHRVVKEHGGVYISDEVQTGVGRTGKHFFAIEESGVSPDILTTAKSLGSGAPVGAVIARAEIADAMKDKVHFNTFGGDPYQSRQATEVISIIEDENLIDNAKVMGDHLRNGLRELQKQYPTIGDVRGRGLMAGVELVKDPISKAPDPESTTKVLQFAKDFGLLIGKGGLFGNVLRIAPSLDLSSEELEQLLSRLGQAIGQAYA